MGISFGSINTGLPKDIVKQIMNAERIPLKKMEDRKGKIEAKKALVSELQTLMNDMKSNILANGNARSPAGSAAAGGPGLILLLEGSSKKDQFVSPF